MKNQDTGFLRSIFESIKPSDIPETSIEDIKTILTYFFDSSEELLLYACFMFYRNQCIFYKNCDHDKTQLSLKILAAAVRTATNKTKENDIDGEN